MFIPRPQRATDNRLIGGKAKPLKAPKKQARDLDEEDKAFLERKKAGTQNDLFTSMLPLRTANAD
ncbi:hypothetical protein SODALDRAFT_329474 [Sodiomyces alkalinus F11]|uniref:Uncharacterized protein n=1 Tax=Sodiomyces alkalinus (strain CBS 110278 / VKM F-3762 / F11) TaxID=1314773 RepID=A0A3N2PJV5_SODAK|nr:hypothetical protein SODALDRAFT_329474 [Sodiomyces alkalinus F11]ROT34789.1 hypothetical protein SODALDRAFT_329474 [Sodiomyces alkalinus F11]